MSVALIACSNGYGHTRRLLSIYFALQNKGIKAKLFAKKKYVNKIVKLYSLSSPNYLDFDSNTNIENLINGKALDWEYKIPSLKKYKVVVSDNLPDILSIREDAILSGSFLWHSSLKKINSKLKSKHEFLLSNKKPIMISSQLFTPKYLLKQTDLRKVGLYSFNKTINKKNNQKKNLLISFGSNGNPKKFERFLNKIIKNNEITDFFDKIWIEPSLYSNNLPKNCFKASYSKEMYNALNAAIIRPGIGTISDLLENKVNIIMYFEKNNLEMQENANTIKKLNLGIILSNYEHLIKLINSNNYIIKNPNFNINFNGAKEAVNIIMSKL
tara:strand:+ start:53 stop:1033 length:981 start_codon:yes stop_codon:yes gene_type:complete